MHGITFLQDLAVVMLVAGVVTVIFHRLRQPVVLGYILAGFIIGPHTPPFPLIHDEATIHTLAEMGIIFLMFALGMEFNLRKVKAVGAGPLIAAALEILVMLGAGYQLGRMFGWNAMDSLFLGAMLSMSSTTIIIKALSEMKLMKERFAELMFGILIIEDIMGIVMLALLSGIAMTGSLGLADVGATLGKLSVFLVTALVVGLIIVPRLLGYVARFRNNEMLLVVALGLCLGFCLLAAGLGYSVALGAFVIGALMAEAREAKKIEHLVEPVKDMFSAVFFVAIGMLINPPLLVEHLTPILLITLIVITGKVASCGVGVFLAGQDGKTSMRTGMGLAQIGEFSFIIAALGQTLKVTSPFLYPIAVAVSAITTLLTPYLIKWSDPLTDRLSGIMPTRFREMAGVYTRWVGARNGAPATAAAKLIRKWTLQIAVNLVLVIAVFITAAFSAQNLRSWLPGNVREAWYGSIVIWAGAFLVALPFLVASFRKLQALGLLVAEIRVPAESAGEGTQAIRSVIAQSIPLAGLAGMVVLLVVVSSPLLPNKGTLAVLLIAAAGLTLAFRRTAIRVYARGQEALTETLNQPPAPAPEPEIPSPVKHLLREAMLTQAPIDAGSPVAGRMIRETKLRATTGASIVGIERNGESVINPDPDEELQAGDVLLLLGHPEQLEAARLALQPSPRPEESPPA